MNFKEYYNLIKEGFDIAGFLTNPNNTSLNLQDLLDSFESDYGGKILGGGAFAIVLSHSSWNYVLKIFNDDSCYLKYVRFCMKNQNNKFVPKLLDKPRKITPTYKRRSNQQNLYTVKMENLEPLSDSSIDANSIEKMSFAGMALNDEGTRKDLTVAGVDKYIKSKYPSMSGLVRQLVWNRNSRALFDFLKEIKTIFPSCSLDLHSDNFMSRKNGEIVVTDPFSTPYDSSTWRRRVMAKLSEKPNFNPSQTKFITQYDSDHRDKFISGKERVKFESFNSTLKIDGNFETATVLDDSDDDSPFETEKTVLKSVQIIPNSPDYSYRSLTEAVINSGNDNAELSRLAKIDQNPRNKLANYYNNPTLSQLTWQQKLDIFKKDNNIPPEQEEIFPSLTKDVKNLVNTLNFTYLTEADWENLFILVQHADDDISFQKKLLPLFYKKYGDTGIKTPYQMLYDRISCAENGTQKYNTQDLCG
jgi:hypothetical protein